MKHLKKLTTLLLMLMATTMVFTSCGKDDDDEPGSNGDTNNKSLVGTWYCTVNEDYFTFMADGTGIYWAVNEDGIKEDEEQITWVTKGDILVITYTWYDEKEGKEHSETESFQYRLLDNGKTLWWGGLTFTRQ